MEASINQLNIFEFSGNKTVSIECACDDCRENCIDISTYNNKYKIETDCPICGDTHTYNINKNVFWTRPVITLKCPMSGIDTLFIGEHDLISDSIKKQQHIFDDARMHHDELNLVLEILECLNSFADDSRLYCECGCKNIQAMVANDEVILSCPDCNNKRIFEISIDTLSMLLNLNSIILNNM